MPCTRDCSDKMPVITPENLMFVECGKTEYIECRIAYWMWRIIPVFLIVFGLIGNIFNITVLSRKQLRKRSICVYLIFLAVSDITVLCTGPLVQIVSIFFGIDVFTLSALSCSLPKWLNLASGIISCWLIVLVTVERTLVTLFPVTAKTKMTPRNALIASLTLVFVISLCTGHFLYGFTITDKNVNMTEVTTKNVPMADINMAEVNMTDINTAEINMTGVNMTEVKMTELNITEINMTEVNETRFESIKTCTLRQGEYMDFYRTAWGVITTMIGPVLPICFIVTGNAIVGISVVKRRRALRQRTDKKGFSTRIFFVLCGMFFITTAPLAVYPYFVLRKNNEHVDEHTFAQYQLINIVMRSLSWCNFSFNFLLYFMTGSLFGNEFQKMFGGCKRNVEERS